MKLVLSPSVKCFSDRSKAILLLWVFFVFICLVFVMPLCASVYLCIEVTCWERPRGGGGTQIFSVYVGSDQASTVHPKNISGISSTSKKYLKF